MADNTLCDRCLVELNGPTYPPGIDLESLRPIPRNLLGVLWSRHSTWVKVKTLIKLVWGDDTPSPVALRTQIWDLRKALIGTPYLIDNRLGLGYRLSIQSRRKQTQKSETARKPRDPVQPRF